jgi:hypothetical protein
LKKDAEIEILHLHLFSRGIEEKERATILKERGGIGDDQLCHKYGIQPTLFILVHLERRCRV